MARVVISDVRRARVDGIWSVIGSAMGCVLETSINYQNFEMSMWSWSIELVGVFLCLVVMGVG